MSQESTVDLKRQRAALSRKLRTQLARVDELAARLAEVEHVDVAAAASRALLLQAQADRAAEAAGNLKQREKDLKAQLAAVRLERRAMQQAGRQPKRQAAALIAALSVGQVQDAHQRATDESEKTQRLLAAVNERLMA